MKSDITNSNVENKRLYLYDWLRIIATVFVVIGHSSYLVIPTSYGGVSYELPSMVSNTYYSWLLDKIRFLSGWVYGFHMPLFFMLSGAVLALKPIAPMDRFVKSKFKRLVIPYFVYGWLFMLPVKYLGDFYTKDSLKLAMQGFLSGIDSGHLWFLTSLFWCMMAFVLIEKIVSKLSGTENRYVILMLSGLVYYFYTFIPFDILGLKQGLSYLFWFALGYVFEKERAENGLWNNKKLFVALAVVLIIEILNVKYYILDQFFVTVVGSLLTLLIADICSRFLGKCTETGFWNFLTRNLFYIYIFHDPLEYIVLKYAFSNNWLLSSAGCYIYTFSRTVAVFIISMLLGELINIIKSNLKEILSGEKETDPQKIKANKFRNRVAAVVLFLMVIGFAVFKYNTRNDLYACNLTDDNWTNGVFNWDKSVVLFNNTASNYSKLSDAKKLKCGKEEYNIVNFQCDQVWITIYLDKEADNCAYPSVLKASE